MTFCFVSGARFRRGQLWCLICAVKLRPQTHPFLLPLPSAQWTNVFICWLPLLVWVCVHMCGVNFTLNPYHLKGIVSRYKWWLLLNLDLVYGLTLSKIAHIQNIYCRELLWVMGARMPSNDRKGKDLATRGAARGLVYLCLLFNLLSLAKGKSAHGILPCTW